MVSHSRPHQSSNENYLKGSLIFIAMSQENFLGRFITGNLFKCSLLNLSPAKISLMPCVHTGCLRSFISQPFLIYFAFLSSNINPGGRQASPVPPEPSRPDGHILSRMGAERRLYSNVFSLSFLHDTNFSRFFNTYLGDDETLTNAYFPKD